MNEKKDKIRASIITVVFHLLLLLLLVFLGLSTPLPLPEEEGVEVNLGFSEVGSGQKQDYKPLAQVIPPPPQVVPEETQPTPKIEEKVVTQETDEAPAIVEEPKEKPKPKVIKKTKKETPKVTPKKETKPTPVKEKVTPVPAPKPEVKSEPKPEPKPVVDQRLIYPGKKNSVGSSSQGPDDQAGDKGKETGDVNSDGYDGLGGFGNGISFSLGDRKAKALPKPVYNSDDQGKVVVSIWVNKYGAVTRTEILQKGTTVTDINLRNMAKKAALKARFTADLDAPEIQKGSISYHFIKLN
ncbi:MAG: energy transducer TonB [Bacteroidetes bacterium 4572_77]|nr:MAG: energy transducer TonB [Bacteroidetes bacterium 4572_77]